MAPPAKGPQKGAPAKKGKVKGRYKLYDKGTAKNRSCPKCGPGFLLGSHKDRLVCGKCQYVEIVAKS